MSERPESSPVATPDRRWLWLAVWLPLAVAVDQVTKYLADSALAHRPTPLVVIDGFFMLRYSRNAGAFFSIGENLPDALRRPFFVVVALVAAGFIFYMYRRAEPQQRALKVALLCFLAGAFGNLIDRVLYGTVIDFMHLHYEDVFHWATFNVADIYIAAGLVLVVYDAVSPRRRAETPSPQGDPPEGEAAESKAA